MAVETKRILKYQQGTRRIVSSIIWCGLVLSVILPLAWLAILSLSPREAFLEPIRVLHLRATLDAWRAFATSQYAFATLNSLEVAVLSASLATGAGLFVALVFGLRLIPLGTATILGSALLMARFVPSALMMPGILRVERYIPFSDSDLAIVALNFLGLTGIATLVLTPPIARMPMAHFELAAVEGWSMVQKCRFLLLPYLRAPLGASAILTFCLAWNDYFLSSMISDTPRSQTLTIIVGSAIGQYGTNYSLLAAGALVALLPAVTSAVLLLSAFRRSKSPVESN